MNEINDEAAKYNQEIEEKGILEGSPEALRIDAWRARLEKQVQIINELEKELGEFWPYPLGIVKRIEIYW